MVASVAGLLRPPLLRPSPAPRACVRALSDWAIFDPKPWLAAIAITGCWRAYELRPRGWILPDTLAVAPSRVVGAGRGAFAARDLPEGLTVGAYPGRLLFPLEYHRKLKRVPEAAQYCWVLGSGRVLDPTGFDGVLCEPLPALTLAPWLTLGAQPTTICLINEPAPGSLVNMRVDETEDGLDALLVTGRPIAAGEELYLDYGKKYDRSDYGHF